MLICIGDGIRDSLFYFHETISVDGSDSRTIMLQRPFAQLNIGTNDITAATNSGLTVDKAAVKLTDVCNRFNLLSGKASAVETENTKLNADNTLDVTFAAADIPVTKTGDEGEGETFPVGGYSYLAMNYVLVGSDNATSTVTLTVDGVDHTYSGVPLRANYRTNIYGALLTSPTDYTVTINSEFGGSSRFILHNGVFYSTVADAVRMLSDSDDPADNVIYFGGGEYELPYSMGRNMTLIGQGEGTVLKVTTYTGTSSYIVVNNATLRYTNNFAGLLHGNAEYNNCIITGDNDSDAEEITRCYSNYSTVYNNCRFDSPDGKYVLNAYVGGNIEFNKCTFNIGDGKGVLISVYANSRNVSFTDCTFTSNSDLGAAAIEVKTNDELKEGILTITNANIDGLNLANGLWRETDNATSSKTTKYTVIIDGETVQAGNK